MDSWKILNPEVDTPLTKRHRDGFFEDMNKMLELSEGQHFGVHVDDRQGIANKVVLYIRETLTELTSKHGMTLIDGLQTIHDPTLGSGKIDFIHEAFDDSIAVRQHRAGNLSERRNDIVTTTLPLIQKMRVLVEAL